MVIPKEQVCVLGLGSNLGDSKSIILAAVEELKKVLTGLRRASLYETEPLDVIDQARFINTAVTGFYQVGACSSSESARKLLEAINSIEAKFGRNRARERRHGERFLDIDILLFGNLIINEPDLTVPHPRLKERRFAMEPLLELLPESSEPGTGLSYRSVCSALPDQGVVKLLLEGGSRVNYY
jgi:2-amino-4-hydroxy-6-hydroxymethyldihydropteridine diphosphokinase